MVSFQLRFNQKLVTFKLPNTQSLVENMADLNYPLRKEVKRDRYVLNKEGLEQAINKAVKETMEQMSKEVDEWINQDVIPLIEESAQEVLDGINVVNNNFVVQHKSSTKKQSKSHAMKFAEELAKALVKSVGDILEDTLHPKGRY